jgi:hypothetical protein
VWHCVHCRCALARGKPFAVVPCCVFARAHPFRFLKSGQHVSTYEQFCQYLLEIAPGSQSTYLPFVGRNRVIFRRAEAAEAAAPPARPARQMTRGAPRCEGLRVELRLRPEAVSGTDGAQSAVGLSVRCRLVETT